jgi:hypothetical protein
MILRTTKERYNSRTRGFEFKRFH